MTDVLGQLLSDPSKISAFGLMSVAITALMRGWVVTANHHNSIVTQYETRVAELLTEKDEFKTMVLHTVETAERALQVAQSRRGAD